MATIQDDLDGGIRFVTPGLVSFDVHGKPRLIGGHCCTCGAKSFPRTPVCTDCLSEDIEAADLGDRGTLYSFTIVHQAPKNWLTPYALGYVDLEGGIRVLAHLEAAPNDLRMDMPVKLGLGVVGVDADGSSLTNFTFKSAENGDA